MRTLFLVIILLLGTAQSMQAVDIAGELKKWHTVTLTFEGPETAENATPNPFLDYRLNVTFSNGATIHVVPGFYAADGNAANTGATSGDKWRVHFTPDQTGTWTYEVSFKQGTRINVAIEGVDPDPGDTQPWSPLDGTSGQFVIADSDKTGVDFRARGRIDYVDDHHFAFAETNEPFVKTGMDSAENFLGYVDFDQTFKDPDPFKNKTPKGIIHQFNAHAGDWQSGDPTWAQRDGTSGTFGKNIIGAVNYLSSQQVNSQYFLTYNIDGGDGMDTWIWRQVDERLRIDVSKTAQWDIVFAHMDRKGVAKYVVLQEQENQAKLGETQAPRSGGGFGTGLNDGRRLYYREMVARFGHHLGLFWLYGEEDGTRPDHRITNATYLRMLDPYDHPIGVHNPVDQVQEVASEIVGSDVFEFIAMQDAIADYNANAIAIRDSSAAVGRPLVVWADEQNPGVDDTDEYRTIGMWQAYMGGVGGVEWYAGGDDQSLDDYTTQASNGRFRDFRALGHFFEHVVDPVALAPDNGVITGSGNTCLMDPGTTYVVHLPNGGSTDLDLSGVSSGTTFTVRWYNPRAGDPGDGGGTLSAGSITTISGGGTRDLGLAPSADDQDWVILVRTDGGGGDTPPSADLQISPTSTTIGDSVTFDASGSTDDGTIVSYFFDFGDGDSITASNPIITHTYSAAGTFTATVTVTDDQGQPATSSAQSVSVAFPSPELSIILTLQPAGSVPLEVQVDPDEGLITPLGSGSLEVSGLQLTQAYRLKLLRLIQATH